MTAKTDKNFEKVFQKLSEIGLLHVSGNQIPNVQKVITGTTSKGSWWADPAGHDIFAVNQLLEDDPDVAVTKLVSAKVTFVHRKWWPQLFAVATAREEWQLDRLSVAARSMLKAVDEAGMLLTNKLPRSFGSKPGELARELELRLLIYSEQIHTESGSHAKQLETWASWAKRNHFKYRSLDPSKARQALEKRLHEINQEHSGSGRLPWNANKS
jgi:hypothetical protein